MNKVIVKKKHSKNVKKTCFFRSFDSCKRSKIVQNRVIQFFYHIRELQYMRRVPHEFNLTLCLPLPETFLSNTVIIKNNLTGH